MLSMVSPLAAKSVQKNSTPKMMLGLLLGLWGWGGGGEVAEQDRDYVAEVVYDPDGAGFWSTPWPSDTRLTAEGTVDLTGFPGAESGKTGL